MFKNILILLALIFVLSGLIIWQLFTGNQKLEIKNLSENSSVVEEMKPLKVLLVGDIMLDRKVELLMIRNGFFYPFEKINSFLKENDIVVGNLEGPISENPRKFSLTAMEFAFDVRVIESLASSNFEVLSLANNHTLNMGQAGLVETKELLGNAGIDWVGEPWECSRKLSVKENLVFLAFNKTFNGCKNEEILEIIKTIKKSTPEKFLIVGIHWGDEYKLKSNQLQKDLAHKIIDAGADLIVGHHPHVVQEIEKYKDKLIFYSLGNFIFDQYFSQDVQESLIVGLEIYPTKIIYKLYPIESNLSQPSLMDEQKAKIFLEKKGFNGIMEIKREKKVCFNDNCFYVELAETSGEKSQGLMYRENLAENRGMLFIFDQEGPYSFWMKNTLIPLDIIWLDENKEVVFIVKNAQPCKQEICPSIKPDNEAKYVLEINAGLSDKLNLKIGDKVIW